MRPAVIAIGNRWRGDDAVGPLTLDAICQRLPDGVDATELDGESTRLIDAWADRPWVVVVDAIRTGAPPGHLHRIDLSTQSAPRSPTNSTHGAGLAEALALGSALDRLPRRLVALGLEPGSVAVGGPLSPEIVARLPDLADAVLSEVVASCA